MGSEEPRRLRTHRRSDQATSPAGSDRGTGPPPCRGGDSVTRRAVYATLALLVLANCPPQDRGRPVGPDLRIMWPTPLPFCAQVHGQVDESEGRGRDDGRPPIPATFRHGGHNQSGGYQDLRAGEPESPPRGKPRSHSVSVFVGEQREFRAPGSRRRSVHASSGPGLCPLHTANRCRRPSGRSNCYTVRYWHRMLSRIAVGSDHGKLKSDRWSRQYRNKG